MDELKCLSFLLPDRQQRLSAGHSLCFQASFASTHQNPLFYLLVMHICERLIDPRSEVNWLQRRDLIADCVRVRVNVGGDSTQWPTHQRQNRPPPSRSLPCRRCPWKRERARLRDPFSAFSFLYWIISNAKRDCLIQTSAVRIVGAQWEMMQQSIKGDSAPQTTIWRNGV